MKRLKSFLTIAASLATYLSVLLIVNGCGGKAKSALTPVIDPTPTPSPSPGVVKYTLSAFLSGYGSVNFNGSVCSVEGSSQTGNCTGSYDANTIVNVVATPKAGYTAWMIYDNNGTFVGATSTITMNKNHLFNLAFIPTEVNPNPKVLYITLSGTNASNAAIFTVDANNNNQYSTTCYSPTPCSITYPLNTRLRLAVNSHLAAYVYETVDGALPTPVVVNGLTYWDVTMNSNHSYSGIFNAPTAPALITKTLSISLSGTNPSSVTVYTVDDSNTMHYSAPCSSQGACSLTYPLNTRLRLAANSSGAVSATQTVDGAPPVSVNIATYTYHEITMNADHAYKGIFDAAVQPSISCTVVVENGTGNAAGTFNLRTTINNHSTNLITPSEITKVVITNTCGTSNGSNASPAGYLFTANSTPFKAGTPYKGPQKVNLTASGGATAECSIPADVGMACCPLGFSGRKPANACP